MGKTKHGLTVAKATEEEFDRVYGFLHPMEALFDGRGFVKRYSLTSPVAARKR